MIETKEAVRCECCGKDSNLEDADPAMAKVFNLDEMREMSPVCDDCFTKMGKHFGWLS